MVLVETDSRWKWRPSTKVSELCDLGFSGDDTVLSSHPSKVCPSLPATQPGKCFLIMRP